MISPKNQIVAFLVVMALVGIAVLLPAARAENNAKSASITCDSTLIALLYIAQQEYGFGATAVDISHIDKGQYTPLFEDMKKNPIASARMAPPHFEDTALLRGVVEGENAVCTQLRHELDAFLYQELAHE